MSLMYIPTTPAQLRPSEIAQLTVRGQNFTEWETVWAQERWAESFAYFRFTTAEGLPPPRWQDLKVAPCDRCQISLGGVPTLDGYVMQRQVAYDADRHQVLLIGKTASFWPYKSSIEPEDANMDGLGIVDMAKKLVSKHGVQVVTYGSVDNSAFKKVQASPGENIWTFLDRYAKYKKVVLSSNSLGQAVLIGDHGNAVIGSLIEGRNIKKMQVVISIEDTWQRIRVIGSTSGSDEQNMGAANDMEGDASGSGCISSTLVIPSEEPVSEQSDLEKRAKFEAQWTDGTMITANITVQGWFSDPGTYSNLWHAGQNVYVWSPMAPLDHVLKVKTCTWTQDNENGTETTLECVNPEALNDGAGGGIDVSPPQS